MPLWSARVAKLHSKVLSFVIYNPTLRSKLHSKEGFECPSTRAMPTMLYIVNKISARYDPRADGTAQNSLFFEINK